MKKHLRLYLMTMHHQGYFTPCSLKSLSLLYLKFYLTFGVISLLKER
jgi:hypothetical protein